MGSSTKIISREMLDSILWDWHRRTPMNFWNCTRRNFRTDVLLCLDFPVWSLKNSSTVKKIRQPWIGSKQIQPTRRPYPIPGIPTFELNLHISYTLHNTPNHFYIATSY